MLKTLGLAVLAALIALLLYAATRPDQFRVERSLRIEAPPERVFALIEDLKGFNTWNPYVRKDPAMKQRYGDVTRGPGAFYAWESKEVGVGSMKITEVQAPTRVTIALDFEQPFTAHNTAEFTLRPDGGATQVTWAMHGPANFMSKLMGVFFDMDRMVGTDFETGLVNLKTAAEAR